MDYITRINQQQSQPYNFQNVSYRDYQMLIPGTQANFNPLIKQPVEYRFNSYSVVQPQYQAQQQVPSHLQNQPKISIQPQSIQQVPIQQQQPKEVKELLTPQTNSQHQKSSPDEHSKEINNLKEKSKSLELQIENSTTFEKTQQLIDIKKYIRLCQQKYNELVEELYETKKQLKLDQTQKNNQPIEPVPNQNSEVLIKQNQELQKKIEEIEKVKNQIQEDNNSMNQELNKLQTEKNNNHLTDNADKNQLIDSINSQQTKITQLSHDVDELTETNNKYHLIMQKKDFFSEYEKLLKEVQLLRVQNDKLNIIIKERNEEIAKIQGKEVQIQIPSIVNINKITPKNKTNI